MRRIIVIGGGAAGMAAAIACGEAGAPALLPFTALQTGI